MADIEVPGLADLFARMDALPLQVQKKTLRGALRAGQKIIMERAKSGVPVSLPSQDGAEKWGAYMGALRDSIKISTRIEVSAGRVVARLTAGNYKAFYARWVEFGTRAHVIRGHGYKVLTPFGGHPVLEIHHPGARKNPFMRTAIDSGVQEATAAVASYIRDRLPELDRLPEEQDA